MDDSIILSAGNLTIRIAYKCKMMRLMTTRIAQSTFPRYLNTKIDL